MSSIIPIYNDKPEDTYRPVPKRIINEDEIVRASKNDPVCFKPIYENYYRAILNYINQRVDDLNIAEEIASNTFYKALVNLKKYHKTDVPFSAWLYKIAYNETMQFFRKSAKTRNVILDERVIENLADEVSGKRKHELINVTIETIETLDQQDVELIDLKYYQQKSISEIAYILGISESNAKVKSHRLIKKIKSKIEENYGKI